MLLAGLNAARYKQDGKLIEVPGDKVFSSAQLTNIEPCFSLEVSK